MRFAAHIPLAAVWIVLSFVKVATCDATGSCYRHEKKMHVYVSVGLLRAKLAGGGQNLRVGEGEGPGDGEGLFPLVTVKDLNLFPWPSMLAYRKFEET